MKWWKQLAPSLKLALASCIVSFLMVVPQITGDASGYADSDEFLLISQNLSVAHPPGYGLLSLAAYIFNRLIFWGTTAFAGNLLSALFSAASVAVVSASAFLVLHRMARNVFAVRAHLFVVLVFPLIMLISGIFGMYASILEVTSLAALLFALTLGSSLLWHAHPLVTNRFLYAAAVVFGLGVSHYQPMIIIAPVLLGLLVNRLRQKNFPNRTRTVAVTMASFGIALILPYISIFWVNAAKPDSSWSFEPSLKGIMNLATRQDYSGYFLDDNVQRSAYFGGALLQKFLRSQIPYWHMLLEQTSIPYVACALLGLVLLLKHMRGVGIFFASLWLMVGPIFIGFLGTPIASAQNLAYYMSLGIFQRQFVLSFVVVGMLATIGAVLIALELRTHTNHRYVAVVMPLFACILLLLHANKFGYGFATGHKQLIPTYARLMLESAKTNSVIICGSDMACFGLLYASEVEKVRPDVTVLTANNLARKYFLEKHPEFYPFTYDQNPFFAANLITWNVSKRPTYLTNPSSFYIKYIGLHGDPFYLIPHGLLFEVSKDLPHSLAQPSNNYTNQVLSTPVPRYDWFMRGYREYLADIAYFSGVLASHLDQKAVAQSYLDQALSLKPDYAAVTEWLAKLYTPGLIASYTIATASDLDYGGNYQKLLDESQFDDAYSQLLKASYLDPQNQSVRLELAKLYARGNFPDLAKTELEHLALFGPVEASISAEAQSLHDQLR